MHITKNLLTSSLQSVAHNGLDATRKKNEYNELIG